MTKGKWAIIVAAVCLVVAVAAVAYAAGKVRTPVTPVLRTRGIELVDRSGKARARWLVDDQGGLALAMADRHDTLRLGMWIDASNGNARIAFCDKGGTERMGLVMSQEGNGSLYLLDRQHTMSVALTMIDGQPTFALGDKKGKSRTGMSVAADGSSALRFLGTDGKERVEVGVAADGSGSVRVRDKEGTVVWQAP